MSRSRAFMSVAVVVLAVGAVAVPGVKNLAAANAFTVADQQAPPDDEVVRVGGDVKPPAKIKDVKPVYPDEAKEAGIQGVVVIEAVIAKDGKVASAEVIRSIPELDQAALDAVLQWEFEPTYVKGKAVAVRMTVTINFTLA